MSVGRTSTNPCASSFPRYCKYFTPPPSAHRSLPQLSQGALPVYVRQALRPCRRLVAAKLECQKKTYLGSGVKDAFFFVFFPFQLMTPVLDARIDEIAEKIAKKHTLLSVTKEDGEKLLNSSSSLLHPPLPSPLVFCDSIVSLPTCRQHRGTQLRARGIASSGVLRCPYPQFFLLFFLFFLLTTRSKFWLPGVCVLMALAW
jgi:hypothetical protein